MREQTVIYKGVKLTFNIHEGVIRGYNKFIETNTKISGGGGKVRTSFWTGKVSGNIKPVKSTTTHWYISEFFVVDDTGREIPIKLVNCPHAFRDGQLASVWVESYKMRKYKIVNHSVGSTTIINSIRDVIKSTDYYYNQYLRANLLINILWRSVQIAVLALVIYALMELIRTDEVITSLVGILIIMVPVIIIYKIIKNIIRASLVRGLKQRIMKKESNT